MSEYIERELVMQKFADYVKRSNNSDFASVPTWNQAVQIVEDIPAADVREVKRGKWLGHDDVVFANWRSTGSVECSLCHRFIPIRENFCPNCGADMQEAAV